MLIEPISSGWTVRVTIAEYTTRVNDRPSPSLLALALGFVNVGLTSVGGAAAPLRHVVVRRRHWLSEGEMAETMGIGQALPGAVVTNCAVLIGERFAGVRGALVAVAAVVLPSLIAALTIATFATRISETNARFANAELAITAAVAGLFMANGARVVALVWNDEGRPTTGSLRAARLTVSALGILMVARWHVSVIVVVVALVLLSIGIERRLGTPRA